MTSHMPKTDLVKRDTVEDMVNQRNATLDRYRDFLDAQKRLIETWNRATGDTYGPRGWGSLLVATIQRWQRSGRPAISTWDVPRDGVLGTLDPSILKPLEARLAREALGVWGRMQDPRDPLPLGHDGYLKLYALARPTIPGDYIMLDEAQDTNGVVLGMVEHQQAQLVCVGDRHQQIYEWRGAQNAMVALPAEREARLSTSFRFGPEIAGYASTILDLLGETLPLKGNPDRKDALAEIEKPDAILTRTNSRLLSELIGCLERNERPFVVGGTKDIANMLNATETLMAGQAVESPLEFFGFKNWGDVVFASIQPDGQDLRSYYVAATRGRDVLDVHPQLAEKLKRHREELAEKAAGKPATAPAGEPATSTAADPQTPAKRPRKGKVKAAAE